MSAGPAHSLNAIQQLVREGRFSITLYARNDAIRLGFDDEDIAECIAELDDTVFYKSMASHKRPGHFQDVYKTRYSGTAVYLKLDLCPDAVVISFKEDESV